MSLYATTRSVFQYRHRKPIGVTDHFKELLSKSKAKIKEWLSLAQGVAWPKKWAHVVRRDSARSMGVILDSRIWVGLATGQLSISQVIAAANDAPVFVSVVSLGELAFGVHVCSESVERAVRAAMLRQIEQPPTLPVGPDTAAALGLLAAAMRSSGRTPRSRTNDLWLAAQAIEHGDTLMTLNTADFADLPELRVIIP